RTRGRGLATTYSTQPPTTATPRRRVSERAPLSSSELRASNGSAATSPRIARWGASTRSGTAGRASAATPSIGLLKHAAAPAPSATTVTAAAIHGADHVGPIPLRPAPAAPHPPVGIVPRPAR